MNNVGIFNSRSYNQQYMRDLRRAIVKSPVMFTIESYAEKIVGRYEAALMLADGGLPKGKRLAAEYEKQLTELAAYADELVSVQS